MGKLGAARRRRESVKKTAFFYLLRTRCIKQQQQAYHKVGLGETPRRLVRKLSQYSSLEKFEDAFDAAVHLSFAVTRTISEL